MEKQVADLQEFKIRAIKLRDRQAAQINESKVPLEQTLAFQTKVSEICAAQAETARKKLVQLAVIANHTHNNQQNQLQGIDLLIERIRREYEEFIEVTRIENSKIKAKQEEDFKMLKREFESYKKHSFDEKKNSMFEFQVFCH